MDGGHDGLCQKLQLPGERAQIGLCPGLRCPEFANIGASREDVARPDKNDSGNLRVLGGFLQGLAQFAARRQQAPISVVHSAPMRRTGTDDLPILNNAIGHPVGAMGTAAGPDYGGMNTPSVWRTRTAAAKVDALASNGMDEIEIPAFLRKQAD